MNRNPNLRLAHLAIVVSFEPDVHGWRNQTMSCGVTAASRRGLAPASFDWLLASLTTLPRPTLTLSTALIGMACICSKIVTLPDGIGNFSPFRESQYEFLGPDPSRLH